MPHAKVKEMTLFLKISRNWKSHKVWDYRRRINEFKEQLQFVSPFFQPDNEYREGLEKGLHREIEFCEEKILKLRFQIKELNLRIGEPL